MSSVDYDPVCHCVCVGFCLRATRATFLHASFLSFAGMRLSVWPIASCTSPKCCSAHASTVPLIGLIWPKAGCASIAEPQRRRRDFLPWALPIPRAGQESLSAAILRCARPSGCGVDRLRFQIAIEAAVVAELENSKEK